MNKLKHRIRSSVSALLSVLMISSVFSVSAALNVSAYTYSDRSALDQYAYSGNDLGANYTKASTTFKVWAPTASDVQIKRYTTGSDSESGAKVIETKPMTQGGQGVWSITISGNLAGTYYTYLIKQKDTGETKETVDIYARSTGVNGMRGMVVDLDSTDPAGWETDKRVECPNQTDAVIWELHVRDFSSSSDSGMKNKGKYLAFTETGTTVNGDGIHKTGIDYLEDLGVTHVHLLPVYDYASVDETALSTDQFNWGYDPMNYNTPEGSYSTDPYNGSVRVKEFKQMVQALHNKGIGVVMDVVYNHTNYGGSGKNDWFDFTVPGYYYRQNSKGGFSNGSGCGNETASDRAMYQKFMVDSLKYWATEYHLDGFRFDLMGIHDVDTMNLIRAELDKIDPDILIYGEPWTAEASPCPKPTAVQGNMKLVSEEVAAFNDKVRDAIKGSCFNAADPGFIQGAGFEEALKGGIQASSTTMSGDSKWSKQPSQTVTYTSAHDNYTLYDKLVKSCKGGSGYGNRYDDLVAMNKLAGGIILTSQGMSFFQAGEEFARSKYGDENSYKSPTSVNQLKWQNTITYSDIVSYYKGLIEIRKAYSPFRDPGQTSNGTIYFAWGTNCPKNVVAYTMYNKLNPSTEWNYVAVIHNANASSATVTLQTYDTQTLPSQWVIIADGTAAGTKSLDITGSTVTVPGRSTVVLVDKTSFDKTDISSGCKVTVDHVIKSTGQLYKSETLKGKEGASYSTSPLAELTNQGYDVVSVSGSKTGTFTKSETKVTYYYNIDQTKYGTVTVKYVDSETGASIADDTVSTGLIGTSYRFEPKNVKGYAPPDEIKTGEYTSSPQTITFKYVKSEEETGLKIHYYNSSSWPQVCMYVYSGSGTTATQHAGAWPGKPMTSDGNGWFSGEIDSVDSALFIANNNNNGAQDPTGTGSTGYSVSGECWVKGEKVYPTGKVKVTYTSTDGKVLASETLKGMADGTNTYTTTAKTFTGYELTTSPANATGKYTAADITVNYVYKSKYTPTVLANNSSVSSSSVNEGDTVTVKCAASGGDAPYTYEIKYKLGSGSYKTAQSYSSAASKTISLDTAGTYTIAVTAKDSSGETKEKTFTVNVTGDSSLANTSKISSTSIVLGNTVTVTCSSTGGTGTKKYRVAYKRSSSDTWTTAQDYATTATVKITPKHADTYTIAVKVKDGSGTVKRKDLKLTVKPGELTNTSKVSAEEITLGNTVTVTCSSTGGSGTKKYRVAYKRASSSSWTVAQDFSSTTSVKITPKHAENYTIAVKVKDGNGTIKRKDIIVNVKSAGFTNTSTINTTSITVNSTVTVTCSSTGGTGTKKYRVAYKRSTSETWYTAQDYSTTTTVKITPKHVDTYTIRVKVKDGSSTIKSKDLRLKVTSAGFTNTSKVSETSIIKGSTVKVTCSSTGGSGTIKYAVWYKRSTVDEWTNGQNYSTNKTLSIKPGHTGTYTIRVKAKDGSGKVVNKDMTVKVKSA